MKQEDSEFIVIGRFQFGDRHEGHQMTIENIARVFAPSLFRDDPPFAPNKKKRGSQAFFSPLLSFLSNPYEYHLKYIIA